MYSPPTPQQSAACGRPARHGPELRLDGKKPWPAPAVTTVTETARYGTATATARGRMHQRLARQRQWKDHPGELPVIEGTLIRLAVDRLPGDRDPEPLWLWTTAAIASADALDRAWQAFLRRFDIEHTFRFLKQQLGWTRPKLRDPAAADRWTWLVIAAYAQLYLARALAEDLRLPWQRPCPPGRLTPARVRRDFRNLHRSLPVLASAPKPGKPGPGRPPGSKNRRPATRHDVGKTPKPDGPSKKNQQSDRLNKKLRRVMGVRLLVAEADAEQGVGGDGGCGPGEQAPEGVGAVPGQFHAVGDLAEGRLDAVAPLGDDLQQDGGHGRALSLTRRNEDGGAAGGLGGGEGPSAEALVRRAGHAGQARR